MGARTAFILPTKVTAPILRAGAIRRERLEDELTRAITTPGGIALLCAPAGWGKTTLASAAVATNPAQVGWLHLDEADNDSERFAPHLAAAAGLDEPDPAASPDGPVRSTVDHIIRHLTADGADSVLVLEDYHVISDPDIHDAIDHLAEWLPPHAHLVISTRADPPLRGLARLRASGRVVDIRADQLAFTEAEAAELLATVAGRLTDPTVRTLRDRSEGWPAALYLASLTMTRHDDPTAFAAAFAGDDRLVGDYVRAEFIDNLPSEMRSFMLRTSILDRFCPELCDAVLETDNAARILRDLERSNVMLVPLDANGIWHRYHHLLADWLRDELTLTGGDPKPLHRRAATWHIDHDSPETAFDHAHRAGDSALAIAVAERCWHEALGAGRFQLLSHWLDTLGDTTVSLSARLCVARAQIGLNTGALSDEIANWTEQAENLVTAEDQHLIGELRRNAAIQLRLQGDFDGAVAAARDAVAAASDNDHRVEALCLLGAGLYFVGDLSEAAQHLEAVEQQATIDTRAISLLLARSYRGIILYEQGQRRAAGELAAETLSLASETSLSGWPVLGPAHLTNGLLELDSGSPDRAGPHIETALRLARAAHAVGMIVLALMPAARLAAQRGHTAEAKRLLSEARTLIDAAPAPGRLPRLVDVVERQVVTGVGSVAAADTAAVEDLTDRELSVLRLLPSRLTVREIGQELFVSQNTVKGHVKAIYRKLGVSSRDSCVATARLIDLL